MEWDLQGRECGMTGTAGNRELITVVETVFGDDITVPPRGIYKGMGYYGRIHLEFVEYYHLFRH